MSADSSRTRWNLFGSTCGDLTPQDRRNQQWFVVWIFIWAVSFVVSAILIREGVVARAAPGLISILVPSALGLGVVLSYWRFLSQADELQKKIQLEALAVGFGCGFIAAVSLHLAQELYGLDLELIDLVPVMAFAFAAGLLVARRRYR